ncbi:MAG: hypothetical protein Q8M76_00870 [Spirochaetaceae bacterium]|nr:hypothetical protein [Spirochaetaceae bacterium]
MALASDIAERIVALIGQASGHNVNIMGGEVDEIAISPADAATMSADKPGYNGVVAHTGKRVACIGISGEIGRGRQRLQDRRGRDAVPIQSDRR